MLAILIPNIIYAIRNRNAADKSAENDPVDRPAGKFVLVMEQIGRYSCMVLMWLPLFVRKFGFSNVEGMLIYLVGNALLTAVYFII